MNEYTNPAGVTVAADDNVVAALFENARTAPDRPALAHRDGNRFVDVSTAAFASTVEELAAGLIGLGLEPGTRVAIFMPSRIEFPYLDWAIWAAGCTAVTIYETSAPDQVEWIVGNSDAQAIVIDSIARRKVFAEVADRLPSCKHVFVLEEGGLDELKAHGEPVRDQVAQRRAAIGHDDLATLVYTSGTTGRPKGCMITHGNFIWEVRQVENAGGEALEPGGSTLMFLPLAHIFARVVQVVCVTRGVKVAFSTGAVNLVEELGMVRPTVVMSVPRVFEKVFNTAQHKAGSGVQRKIFDRAVDVATRYSSELQDKGSASTLTKAEHALFEKLVYGKLRHAFGGNLRYAVSGGAPLGARLGHFFRGAGVTILEAYGLTETTAGATMNTPTASKIGSVGRPLPGASVRIADDGEVFLKGGHIFRGYWKNDEATAGVLSDDGWFATGDIGDLDERGFLAITGRKKELIVTAGGKNVAPAILEDRIRAHPLVSQVMVVGDSRPYVAALVTLDVDELTTWAKDKNLPTGAASEELVIELLREHYAKLETEVQNAIDDANSTVSRAEGIRTFKILESDFSIEGGELTPTLKVKRNVVMDKYGDVVEQLYATSAKG